jgi:para-aminobenzoate synthetase component 1
MKIIEELEERGLYSGAVGYFTLMAILTLMWSFRSILYNQEKHFLFGGKRYHLFICSKEYEEPLEIESHRDKQQYNLQIA